MAFVNSGFVLGRSSFASSVNNNNTLCNKSNVSSWTTNTNNKRRSRLVTPTVQPLGPTPTMGLAVGSELIEFTLPINGGGSLSSADIKEGPTILYFYPRDMTSGCTVESSDFRDLMPQIKESGGAVVGVSKDSVESHDEFVAKLDLPFPLISDDGTLCEGFGVWKLRKMGDKEFMGIERSTFIIKDGKIVEEWRGVKSGGHAAKVFEAFKAL